MNNIFKLALGALGVVYGDIGTSPLYAINEIFFGKANIAHARFMKADHYFGLGNDVQLTVEVVPVKFEP